ncbi:MBL-fold metallo-hydrolase superfamily [hydrothermal vent metagenome]|uniref:MBL-fold metallo-hydrolase superfamily n=1 Tax=hydrothermal vent metagenome TaxID=652676 RepID=A0A3B0XPL2_9ZZZZ
MVNIKTFFDEQTFTLTHLVYDPQSCDAVIFDPVLDLDTIGWRTYEESLQSVDQFVSEHKLKLHYVLDTHIHADHLSGMQYLKEKYKAPLVINSAITLVQKTFKDVFNLGVDFDMSGADFDVLVKDGDQLNAGTIKIDVLHTPGHTPACTTYKIENNVFTGDALFVPSIGTGRCDFPKGSAKDLYHSVTEKLYSLADDTNVLPGHDYPEDRGLQTSTTIGESKKSNVDLPANRSESEYVAFMEKRDATLSLPKLIYPSVQINLTAGQLPKSESNGQHYLKIPIVSG